MWVSAWNFVNSESVTLYFIGACRVSLKQKFVPMSGTLTSVEGTCVDVSANPYVMKVLALPKMIGLLIFAVILSLSATANATAVGPPTCGGPGDPCPVPPTLVSERLTGGGQQSRANDLILKTSAITEDLTADDIVATNATVTLAGSGTDYTATITAIVEGEITVQVKANSFSNSEGTFNTQAGEEHRYYYDTIRPAATLGALIGPDASNKFTSTFTVSEPVKDFNTGDFSCRLCYVRGITGSGPSYEVTIESELLFDRGETGTITLAVNRGGISDLAGNGMVITPEPVTYTVADTSPTATIGTLSPTRRGSQKYEASITLSEASTDFTKEDLTITGSISALQLTGSGTSYTVSFFILAEGEVSATVNANSFSNAADSTNTATSNTSTVIYDVTDPVVSYGPVIAVGDGTYTSIVTFTEDVSGFEPADFSLTNATVTLTGSGSSYVATFTPSGPGEFSFRLFSGAVSDAAGNLLSSSGAQQTFDPDAPADTTAPFVSETATTSGGGNVYGFNLVFSENITGLTAADFSIINGTITEITGSDANYSLAVTATAVGSVDVNLSAGSYTDLAGNVGPGASLSVMHAGTPPTAALSPFTGPFSGAFRAGITLSKTSTDFTADDLAVTNGTLTLRGSGTSYEATVTPAADGPVTLQVKSGSFQDSEGSTNTAASNTITTNADLTAPTATIADFQGPTAEGKYTAAITLSEPAFEYFGEGGKKPTFTVEDLDVTNGTVILTGSETSYVATVTPTGGAEIALQVKAGSISDPVGNVNAEASNRVTVIADSTPPSVVISSGATDPVNGAFSVTFTFSEGVTSFASGDITVGNGSVINFSVVSSSVYTATITPAADGLVTVDVGAEVAQDAAGNANTAAAGYSINSDVTAPTAAITTGPTDPVSGSFKVTVTFSEAVTGFDLSDLTVGNGAASALGTTSASVYTATITPMADGPVTVDVAAEAAQDVAGNGNIAATQFLIVNDGTAPTVILSTATADVTGPFTITATFSEIVRGFTADDISIENGAISDFSGSDMVFTATVTPVTIGDIFMSIAEGAADDLAGNASAGDTLTTTAGGGDVLVALEVTTAVLDASTVGTEFTLANPGTRPIFFIASSNQAWAEVTPLSGKIDSLSNLEFDIQLNDLIDDLAPGTYVATVTVEVVDAPSAAAGSGTTNSTARRILAEVPITVEVEERFGNFELVVLTPTGPSTGVSFQYSSDITELNGLSVSANAGERRVSLDDVLQGAYRLEQSIPEGYSLSAITCTGDLDGGTIVDLDTGAVDIDLDASENISCIFENVRDDDAIRIATQRAIRNFMARRGDRVLAAAPDLSNRFAERRRLEGGQFQASGSELRTNMDFQTSLSGFRNRAIDNEAGPSAELTNPYSSKWDLWASAEYARYDDDRVESGVDGKFFAAQFGADYLLKDNLIVGAMVQYDWMSETDKELAVGVGAQGGAEVDGEGLMGGPYLVWQPKDQLTIDVMGLWGSSDNTVNPLGYYSDEFETDRFMVRANVTGEFASGPWRLRPQVSLAHYQDKQDEYVDSLGINIPEQVVSIGRLRAGPEIVWTHQTKKGSQFEIGGSIRAVWNYNGAGLMDPTGRIASGSDSVRADGDISIGTRFANGVSLRAKAGFDGIGKGDFSARSGRLEVVFPFGGKGGSGSKLAANPLEQAGFHRACEADAYLQSFNVSPPAACSGTPRTNLLDTNIAMMGQR